eukprot:TRINITY_DN23684_c0_g1_i2.p1 TRINITY_DN23684_c0_g1~~TRINITY_DN23684_c0_g1_i2.p1  ORF type:complete len:576 (+),score=228.35 TRINITY_DN23684_c0_g1_i2:46-1773(+)
MECEGDVGNGEILTVSLGPFAAAVAAHYWNATSDFDAKRDVLYHQPSSRTGKAVPRAVVLDWAGGSRIRRQWKARTACRMEVDAAPPAEATGAEEAEPEKHIFDTFFETPEAAKPQEPADDSDAQAPADTDTVNWWRFITPELSHRSVQLIPDKIARDYSAHATYGEGQECWKGNREFFEDGTMDSVRYFFEGMDKAQGVNLMTDGNGIFSGIAHELLSEIRDTYGKVAAFTTSLFPHNVDEADDDEDKMRRRAKHFENVDKEVDFEALTRWETQGVNRCLNHAMLSDLSSAYLPVDVTTWCRTGGRAPGWLASPTRKFPTLKVDPTDVVDTSALISTALSTAFAPLAAGDMTLPHYCDVLHPLPSMRVSSLQAALPFPVSMAAGKLHMRKLVEDAGFDAFLPLSHGWPLDGGVRMVARESVAVVSQIFCIRGVHAVPKTEGVSHTQVLNEFWSEEMRTPRTFSSVPTAPQLLPGTFPTETLPPHLNVVGWADENAPAEYVDESMVPTQMPIAAHVSTTCASALMLHSLSQRLKGADRRRHSGQHLEADQWFELQEQMDALVDEYDQGLLGREDW